MILPGMSPEMLQVMLPALLSDAGTQAHLANLALEFLENHGVAEVEFWPMKDDLAQDRFDDITTPANLTAALLRWMLADMGAGAILVEFEESTGRFVERA